VIVGERAFQIGCGTAMEQRLAVPECSRPAPVNAAKLMSPSELPTEAVSDAVPDM
jgi:hypothetical protein